jgi:hypothetical protein
VLMMKFPSPTIPVDNIQSSLIQLTGHSKGESTS